MTDATTSRRFAVALSFPGEHRRFVKSVADHLIKALGEGRVFYDEWYEAELVGLDGDLKLRRYYREESVMVVPFFSEHYGKDWCQIEWSSIRAMLKDRRKEDAVIPVQLDGTKIPGWEEIDFAIRRKKRTARQIADLILAAYRIRFSDSAKIVPADIPTTKSDQSTQRKRELAFLDGLNDESLRQLYTGMNSRSEQQFRHYGDRRMKVELLPVGKDGSLQPKKQDFPDAAEAMLSVKRAALLGEPGGGKSTAIWKLAMKMAETARQNPQAPIPLVVPLREWTLANQPLRDFIASQIGELEPYLDSLLQSRRAALLLDGLNELPVDQRHDKYDQVCRFIKEHPALMAIVSCRKEDYPPELGFDCINISPLDPIRIRQFVENYLHQVERPELAEPLFLETRSAKGKRNVEKVFGKVQRQTARRRASFLAEHGIARRTSLGLGMGKGRRQFAVVALGWPTRRFSGIDETGQQSVYVEYADRQFRRQRGRVAEKPRRIVQELRSKPARP